MSSKIFPLDEINTDQRRIGVVYLLMKEIDDLSAKKSKLENDIKTRLQNNLGVELANTIFELILRKMENTDLNIDLLKSLAVDDPECWSILQRISHNRSEENDVINSISAQHPSVYPSFTNYAKDLVTNITYENNLITITIFGDNFSIKDISIADSIINDACIGKERGEHDISMYDKNYGKNVWKKFLYRFVFENFNKKSSISVFTPDIQTNNEGKRHSDTKINSRPTIIAPGLSET